MMNRPPQVGDILTYGLASTRQRGFYIIIDVDVVPNRWEPQDPLFRCKVILLLNTEDSLGGSGGSHTLGYIENYKELVIRKSDDFIEILGMN